MNKLPFFTKGQRGGMNFRAKSDNSALYLFFFAVGIVACFLVLVGRLFQLTVVKGNYYHRLSENNRIRELLIEPKRGRIVDRKGLPLAISLDADVQKLTNRIPSAREYTSADAIGHIIGYRQKADLEDIKHDSCIRKLILGDKVGKKGAELAFDCALRGTPGRKLIEVSAKEEYVRTLTVIPPTDGQTIQLALDLELQQKAAELLGNRRGAVVVLKPQTGEVLALASSPSFDPQQFEDDKGSRIQSYFKDKSRPIFNRATEGTYPPGSTFKIFLATAALEEDKIDEDTKIQDTGRIKAGPIEFGNWYFLEYGKTEGEVDIIKAIRRSNDIFFYNVGARLGPEKIKTWGEKFGLGRKSTLDFPTSEGTLPTPYWKKEILGENWYLGDTYNLSIGQGYVLATPLQIAQGTAALANGGVFCEPQLRKDEKPVCHSLGITQKTLKLVAEGMRQACTPGGTGYPLFDFKVADPQAILKLSKDPHKLQETLKDATAAARLRTHKVEVACKTGTSESHGTGSTPHAWFTSYAPLKNPEIVVTVLIEESGQGSDVAAPVAKGILEAYFERAQ